jgi:hypothetical protein
MNDAIEDLVRQYMINKMDLTSKKAGIYNNENYVKGR